MRGKDGCYYVLVHVRLRRAALGSACGAPDLSRSAVVAGMGRHGLHGPFRDPYWYLIPRRRASARPCPQTSGPSGEPHMEHLLQEVGAGRAARTTRTASPARASTLYTSDDLINWSHGEAADEGGAAVDLQLPGRARAVCATRRCSTTRARRGTSRRSGQRPYPVLHPLQRAVRLQRHCFRSLDRDLMRIPIEFSNQAPAGRRAPCARRDLAAGGRNGHVRRVGLEGRRRLGREVRVGPRRRRDLRAQHRIQPSGAEHLQRAGQRDRHRAGVGQRRQGDG